MGERKERQEAGCYIVWLTTGSEGGEKGVPGTSRVKVPESTLIRYHERCQLIYVDNRMVAMESESAKKCVTNSLAESTSDGTDLPKAMSTLAV